MNILALLFLTVLVCLLPLMVNIEKKTDNKMIVFVTLLSLFTIICWVT